MINFTEYIRFFRLFDFLTFCWEVKMIDFTEYIGFFRLFAFFTFLVGGQKDQIYWIILNYFRLFDFSTSCWMGKMIDFRTFLISVEHVLRSGSHILYYIFNSFYRKIQFVFAILSQKSMRFILWNKIKGIEFWTN